MNNLEDGVKQRAVNVLKELEWIRVDMKGHHCPMCFGYSYEGHKPDCELGNILTGIRGKVALQPKPVYQRCEGVIQ